MEVALIGCFPKCKSQEKFSKHFMCYWIETPVHCSLSVKEQICVDESVASNAFFRVMEIQVPHFFWQ